jgi:hypothetical protein
MEGYAPKCQMRYDSIKHAVLLINGCEYHVIAATRSLKRTPLMSEDWKDCHSSFIPGGEMAADR